MRTNGSVASDKERLRQAVADAGLADLWSRLEKALRPAIFPARWERVDGSCPVGLSRAGGLPDLPEGFPWPCDAGGPCQFHLQINLADLKPYDTEGLFPDSGLLLFFYDSQDEAGLGDVGHDPVLYFPDAAALRHADPLDEATAQIGWERCETLDYLIRHEDLARADFTQTVTFAVN